MIYDLGLVMVFYGLLDGFWLIIDCSQSFIEILFSFSVAYEEVATK